MPEEITVVAAVVAAITFWKYSSNVCSAGPDALAVAFVETLASAAFVQVAVFVTAAAFATALTIAVVVTRFTGLVLTFVTAVATT